MEQKHELTNQELQEFVDWTRVKIKLHASPTSVFPHKQEIWWISVGKNIGVEINGKGKNFERPVLVITRYNDDASLVAPVTSKIRTGNRFYTFIGKSGKISCINLSQLRSVSHKRFMRKIFKMDEKNYKAVLNKLYNML